MHSQVSTPANPWAAIVGHGKHGRRELSRTVVRALRDRGLRVGGIAQRRIGEGDAHRGYDLVDLATGRQVALARRSTTPELCDYEFRPKAFETARRWATREPYQVVFIEVGRLEASGKGHWPTVESVLGGRRCLAVLCLRPRYLGPAIINLDDPVAALEMPVSEAQVSAFVETLVHRCGIAGRAAP